MKMLTSNEVAAVLGVSAQTVTRNAGRHGIGQKVGTQWIFSAGDVEKLRRQVAANSDRDFSAMGKKGMKERWGDLPK